MRAFVATSCVYLQWHSACFVERAERNNLLYTNGAFGTARSRDANEYDARSLDMIEYATRWTGSCVANEYDKPLRVCFKIYFLIFTPENMIQILRICFNIHFLVFALANIDAKKIFNNDAKKIFKRKIPSL